MDSESQVCVRCFKKVGKHDNYFKIEIYSHGKKVTTNYMHKSCNDEMNRENRKIQKTIGRISEFIPSLFEEVGIQPKRTVRIQ